MTTTLLQPQKLPPANDGHVRDSLTADERLMKQAVARCLKAQVAEVHGRLVGRTAEKGGPGSGNFGHEGRPGEVGGSGPGGGATDNPEGYKDGGMGLEKTRTFVAAHPYLYHITPRINTSAIRREGIKPSKTGYGGGGSYLAVTPEQTEYYNKPGASDSRMFRVSSAEVARRWGIGAHGAEYDEDTGEVIVHGKIPPDILQVQWNTSSGLRWRTVDEQYLEKSLKSRSPASAVPSNTKPWDDMVMREVRPIWFGLFKKGGDKALRNIRRFPKHTRKMAVLSWAEMQASERVEVVTKGGEGSGNFGHAGRPGEVGGSGPGGGSLGNMPIDAVYNVQVYHGTASQEVADIISREGLKPGRSVGMSSQAGLTDPFVFVSPSKATARWYAETNIRGRGKVVNGEVSGRIVRIDKPTSDFGAMADVARGLGQKIGEDGIVDVENLARRMRDSNLSGIEFRDVSFANRRSWIVLPEATSFSKQKSLKAAPSIIIPEWIEDPYVLDALEKEMFKFAHGINQTTVDDLLNELMAGMENGETIPQLADRISGLSDEWIEGWRSEMIARTETARAFSAGHIEAWRSTGVVSRKVWVAAGDACPFCQQMDGTVVKLDENFFDQGDEQTTNWKGQEVVMEHDYSDVNGPPLHPNCRCVLVAELSEEKMVSLKGGPGSGNFGHVGRPGEVGGSGPGGGGEEAMSTEQQNSVAWYGTTAGHQNVNAYLRDGVIRTPHRDPPQEMVRRIKEHLDSTIANIDSAMKPLEKNVRVVRVLRGEGVSRHPEGSTIKDNGYMSTSTDPLFASKWEYGPLSSGAEKGAVLILDVPKGVGAIDVSKTIGSYGESELLLQRGLSYSVRKVEGNLIYADVLQKSSKSLKSTPSITTTNLKE